MITSPYVRSERIKITHWRRCRLVYHGYFCVWLTIRRYLISLQIDYDEAGEYTEEQKGYKLVTYDRTISSHILDPYS